MQVLKVFHPKKVDAKSKFKYVTPKLFEGEIVYHARVNNLGKIKHLNFSRYYDNEREAVIAVDKFFIENGRNPVNILEKKL